MGRGGLEFTFEAEAPGERATAARPAWRAGRVGERFRSGRRDEPGSKARPRTGAGPAPAAVCRDVAGGRRGLGPRRALRVVWRGLARQVRLNQGGVGGLVWGKSLLAAPEEFFQRGDPSLLVRGTHPGGEKVARG